MTPLLIALTLWVCVAAILVVFACWPDPLAGSEDTALPDGRGHGMHIQGQSTAPPSGDR